MDDQEEPTEFAKIAQTKNFILGLSITIKTRIIKGVLVWLDFDPVHDLLSQIPVATMHDLTDICERYPDGSIPFYRKQLDGVCMLAREPELLFGLCITQEQLQKLLSVLDKANQELFEWEGTPDEKDLQIQAEIANHLGFLYEAVATHTPLADLRVQQNKLVNVGDSAEKWLTHQAAITADIENNKDTAKLIVSRLVSYLPDGIYSFKVYSAQLDKETALLVIKKFGLETYVNHKEAIGVMCTRDGYDEDLYEVMSETWKLLEELHVTLSDEDTVINSFINTLAVAYVREGTLRVTGKVRGLSTESSLQTHMYGYHFSNCSISAVSKEDLFWSYVKSANPQNVDDAENITYQLAPDLGI